MTFTDNRILETYEGLFRSLNLRNKMALIKRLFRYTKADNNDRDASFYASFGAFPDDKTAEEIVAELKAARMFRGKDIQL